MKAALPLCMLAMAGLAAPDAMAARLTAHFDDGSAIVVDNISSFPESTVRTLVLAADRSTQTGCPFNVARKGLMKSGDRVVVSDRYVAWLDLTATDGVAYPAGMSNGYTRSGELAGFWSLDPATRMFKYFTPASPYNCWNWPRNELLPGSASPNGEKFWWDRYAPPSEHTISVVTALDPSGNGANDSYTFLSTVYSQSAGNGQWSLPIDGRDNGDGSVTFMSTGRMVGWNGQVDIVDGNDGNGIQGVMQYELERVFRSRDILVAWRFSPSRTVSANNLYVYYWIAHAPGQGNTGSGCGGVAETFRPLRTFTSSWYAQSSVPLAASFATGGMPAGSTFPAGQSVAMVPGAKCNPGHVNQDINTWQSEIRNNTVVGNGTWLRAGESASVYSSTQRYLTLLNLMGYPNGTGDKHNPYDFRFNRMVAANETWDGHYGFGIVSGPYTNRSHYSTLSAGKWYSAIHALTSDY
jgi:hypothetical protein